MGDDNISHIPSYLFTIIVLPIIIKINIPKVLDDYELNLEEGTGTPQEMIDEQVLNPSPSATNNTHELYLVHIFENTYNYCR